jgi:hypothetical protein
MEPARSAKIAPPVDGNLSPESSLGGVKLSFGNTSAIVGVLCDGVLQ